MKSIFIAFLFTTTRFFTQHSELSLVQVLQKKQVDSDRVRTFNALSRSYQKIYNPNNALKSGKKDWLVKFLLHLERRDHPGELTGRLRADEIQSQIKINSGIN